MIAIFVIVLLVSGGAAFAQFTALATDRSGERLLFLTKFRQTGSQQIPDTQALRQSARWRPKTALAATRRR